MMIDETKFGHIIDPDLPSYIENKRRSEEQLERFAEGFTRVDSEVKNKTPLSTEDRKLARAFQMTPDEYRNVQQRNTSAATVEKSKKEKSYTEHEKEWAKEEEDFGYKEEEIKQRVQKTIAEDKKQTGTGKPENKEDQPIHLSDKETLPA